MKPSRLPGKLLLAALLATAAVTSGCGGGGSTADGSGNIITTPTVASSISAFAASLLALVTGSSCATALPANVNAALLTDDMTAQDANTVVSGNCS